MWKDKEQKGRLLDTPGKHYAFYYGIIRGKKN